ncbi:MAG: phosphotransferase [Chloroflexota bacterium]
MQKSDLTSSQLQLIDCAIQTTFSHKEWVLLEELGGGLSTSILYKIGIDDYAYVVRLSDPSHPHNNLELEYMAMKLAATQALAPQLYYADPQTGIALMEFIRGSSLYASRADSSKLMPEIACMIRTLHQGPAFQNGIPITDKVEILFKQIRPDLAATTLMQHGMAQMHKLAPQLKAPDDKRPSHCDINPGNLLFDGSQLWLVDWALAAQENLYFDLACCSNFFFYQNKEREEAFLHAYFERPLTLLETEKYTRMRTFVNIFYGVMFVYLSGMHGAPLLDWEEIDLLPDYPQFLARIGQGQESMENPLTLQRLGFVYLKAVQSSKL